MEAEEPLKIDIMINIGEGDELDPSFIDYFSKYIVNTTEVRLDESLLNNRSVVSYSDFFSSLKTLHEKTFKINKFFGERLSIENSERRFPKPKSTFCNMIRKGSTDSMTQLLKTSYKFTFESHLNYITIILDLSPYMTIF